MILKISFMGPYTKGRPSENILLQEIVVAFQKELPQTEVIWEETPTKQTPPSETIIIIAENEDNVIEAARKAPDIWRNFPGYTDVALEIITRSRFEKREGSPERLY